MSRHNRSVLPEGSLDASDHAIITALQEGFPLSPRPFAEAAEALGLDEADLIARLTRLREIGAITRIGPFFDAAAMGGASCLCAMNVPEDSFDEVVTKINAHAEVTHNYARDHRLNMWFVLATDSPEGIDRAARAIRRETGLEVLMFPKLEEFFIDSPVQA